MIKKGDIVKINYTGYVDGKLFDTTEVDLAKKYNLKGVEGPITIIVGERFVIPGVDDSIVGKKESDFYEIKVAPKDAFGERNSNLVRVMSLGDFKKHNINPYVGMALNIDGIYGIVKSVSGGRVIVDFNHPLAGKTLTYKVKILSVLKDNIEKIKGILSFFRIKEFKISEKIVEINQKLNDFQKKHIKNLIEEHVKPFTVKFK